MYTTKEAARRLDVSERRIRALIGSGDLKAQKFGGVWMVDEESVRARLQRRCSAGRPKMGEKNAENLVRCTLMSKDRPVVEFTYHRRTGQVADLKPLDGVSFAPLGIGARGKEPDKYDLASWLSARSIPDFRRNVRALLHGSRFASTAELMLDSWGLSLSDPYWLAPVGCDVQWGSINYYENGYDQTLGDFMLDVPHAAFPRTAFPRAASGKAARGMRTPDVTTAGALVKTWMRKDGVDYLVKGGAGAENREPYNELLATRLLGRILEPDEYVPYGLVERRGRVYSSCAAMTSLDWELVPAADVMTAFSITEGRDLHRSYLRALSDLGISNAQSAIDKMIVADYLMANFDRHVYNFGLLRNTEQLDWFRIAPLFDNGCGFYSRATADELRRPRYFWESHPFREYPSQQLALVEDVSWFDAARLDGFVDEVAEVLEGNSHLSDEFIEGVQRHTQRQIDAVADLAAERSGLFAGF
ncbi:DNA-binding protein [Adlercreutzia sp. ZJ473]|uniref:DNA-binding protein n=1 Tax=Adlercreutzia sp. ZJ473 TaxID=2722822 RepID=UPI001555A9ED|nr:DNA-binding protein [Adlercreutzia sp. ZJ473]